MIHDIRRIFIYLALMVLVFFVVELYSFLTQTENDEAVATAQVTEELELAKQKFEGRLKELMLITESLATNFTENLGDSLNLMQKLEDELSKVRMYLV